MIASDCGDKIKHTLTIQTRDQFYF